MAKTTQELLNEPQRYFFIGKEKEFEDYVVENLNDLCDGLGLPKVKKVKRQKRYTMDTYSIKPDLIVIHDDDTYSVFELKCTNEKHPSTSVAAQTAAIGQLLLYRSTLNEKYKVTPRMFLVDTKIHPRTVCVFSDLKLPITLIEIQNGRVFVPYARHENI